MFKNYRPAQGGHAGRPVILLPEWAIDTLTEVSGWSHRVRRVGLNRRIGPVHIRSRRKLRSDRIGLLTVDNALALILSRGTVEIDSLCAGRRGGQHQDGKCYGSAGVHHLSSNSLPSAWCKGCMCWCRCRHWRSLLHRVLLQARTRLLSTTISWSSPPLTDSPMASII